MEDFEEHLVPELCEMVRFPAVYWLKATALPSILHRVNQLLLAEQLRVQIANDIGIRLHDNLRPLTIDEDEVLDVSKCSSDDASDSDEEIQTLEETEKKLREMDLTVDGNFVNIQFILQLITNFLSSVLNHTEKYGLEGREPHDLDRHIENIQRVDIEYYFQFMQGSTEEDVRNLVIKIFFNQYSL